MKKRIVIGLSLFLTVLLGLTGTVGYLTFLRPPANPPADACTGKAGQRPRVVAAGASMTQGALGADWVAALRARPELGGYEFVNAGINGNTTDDLRLRMDTDVVACRPAAVTILIGTNDVRNEVRCGSSVPTSTRSSTISRPAPPPGSRWRPCRRSART
ncbi:GDSL-type esterase/lipase family protein [Nonomuraea sp. NPDC050404]|uniref:SGNH/GDSL hydrolase family protein n=1 Tax=Nonomuraea sp. NPDC050404 TaxID=3155783 RepID=UPI0033CDFE11